MPVVLSPNLRDDERLLNPLSVTVMVVALGALLVLLFPSDQMEEHLAQFEVADEISAKYLQVWLRVEPYDSSARLLLVRHLRALGHTHQALAELQPLLKQKGPLGAQARQLSVHLRLVKWQALAVDEPEREALTGELIASIRGLSKEELAPEERVELAVACLWMERPELAANIYAQLALEQPARSFDRWLEAGRWYLASGRPDKAAKAFDSAARSTSSAVEAPRAAVLALDASRASNDALERARVYAAAFANQPTVLDRAVSIALAANNPRLASIWMEARARLDPEDQSVLRRKLEVELAAGHLQDAFSTSLELVRLEPKNNAYRLRLAEISEWVGQPQQALTQWTWLATHSPSTHAQDKALSLAKALWDWDAIVLLTDSRSRRTGLSIPELLLANRALEELAEPDRAESLTQTYLERRPGDKEAWEYLVSLRRRKRDLEGALQTQEAIDARFGKQTKSLVVQAQILRQLRRPDQALARLRDHSRTADPNEADFWALLGDLAWMGRDYATAEQAYLWGWKAGVLDEVSTERLIEVSMRTGPPSRWLPIAEKAWEKFQKPTVLLRAMDALARTEQWDRLAFFIGQIRANESAFSGHELYWLARARLAAHQQRYAEAFQAFRHALSIQPGSEVARSERLALALEHGSRSELASAADPYGLKLTDDPGELALYADSLSRLDRRSEALWWFRRAAMANDALPGARLAYATQLEQSGYLETANRVRGDSRRRLHSTVSVPRLDLSSAQARQSLRLYAELVYRREGVAPAMRWLQPLLAVSDPEARELVINWQVERGNIPMARSFGHAKLHPWTRLALAMATHQSAEIRRITTEEGDSLSSMDKVAALRRLNEPDRALRLTRSSLAGARGADAEALNVQLQDLSRELPSSAKVTSTLHQLGPLRLLGVAADYDQPTSSTHAFGFTAQFAQLTLRGSEGSLKNDAGEAQFALRSHWRTTAGDSLLIAGGNLRDNQWLWTGKASHSQTLFTPSLEATALGAFNETADESGVLRMQSTRHEIQAGLNFNLTSRELIQTSLGYRHYQGRSGGRLADGLLLRLDLVERLFLSHPDLRIRLDGSIAANRPSSTLPSDFLAYVPPGTPPSALVPASLNTVGVGLSWAWGPAQSRGLIQALRYEIDTWCGWIGPPGRVGYSFKASAGLPVLRMGEINISAFHGTYHGALPGQTDTSVEIAYLQRLLL